MKNWILLDSYGYGESMWEENSYLYWCGGDYFAITWERSAFGQMPMKHIEFYHGSMINEAWENEQASYDAYIT